MANDDQETLSLTYTLIHNFLVSKGHDKAAKSLRKAAKPVVDVKNAPAPAADILTVVGKWQSGRGIAEKEEESSAEDSSEEESSTPAKPAPVPAKAAPAEADSSSSDSEDEPAPPPPPVKTSKKRKRLSEPGPNGAPSTPRSKPNGLTAPAGTPTTNPPPPGPPATEPPHKKHRTVSFSASAEPTSSPLKPDPTTNAGGRKQNVPFSRIKADDVTYADERLKDNTFDARGGGTNDYGAKASRDLIVTRGAGFRKEKNKKKRGSYIGGEITLKSHSIKFDD